jgi:fused signal recognition particle receptor
MPLARVKVWTWAGDAGTLADAGGLTAEAAWTGPDGVCAKALQEALSQAEEARTAQRKFGFIECMILQIQAMFSFFKKKSPTLEVPSSAVTPTPPVAQTAAATPTPEQRPAQTEPAHAARQGWLDRLKAGLRKTGASITTVFTGTRIDDELYEELETALLVADTGVKATEHLLQDLKRRVKEAKATEPSQVKTLLADAITDLLLPLQKPLSIGDHQPTVIMVAGVNGAGKTTSIGKLTKHLADEGLSVLLAAADTFRAAAKEQLAVWATRNTVEIVSQQGGDPAAVSFDAVSAGRARGRDVVLVDTAGRLPTQLHLMEELKKIKRVVQKAEATAPHEVLLVIDGNTGQNALAQVKAFDDTLGLTGLIVTKLDGTAKGGVLCAIAREKPIPVYFIGVGEKLEDLETFNAREFAQALLS